MAPIAIQKLLAAFICLLVIALSAEAVPGFGSCQWISDNVILNSSVMASNECVDLGGNCCDWYCSMCTDGCCWNDGVGAWEDPVLMSSSIPCQGCYHI